jgi:hypothetical protein
MKVKNSTMQAFPFIEPHEDDNIKAYHPGMTMRDEFAKAAMQGLLASSCARQCESRPLNLESAK